MNRIPSTIADAASRRERAEGRRRLQICIASGHAGRFPLVEEVTVEVGAKSCRAKLERRADSGALVLRDAVAAGPGELDLASMIAELGLGVGDHPVLELAGDDRIGLHASGPQLGQAST